MPVVLDLNNAPVETMMTEDIMSSPSPRRSVVTFNDIVASRTPSSKSTAPTNKQNPPRRYHHHRKENQREDGGRRSTKVRELAHDAVRTVGYISITVANAVSKSLNCSSNDTTTSAAAATTTTSTKTTTNDKPQDLDTTAEESDEDSVSATKDFQAFLAGNDDGIVIDIPSTIESSRKSGRRHKKTRKTKSRCVITVRPLDKVDREEMKESTKPKNPRPKLCGLNTIMENNCVTKTFHQENDEQTRIFVPLDTNHELLSASGAMDDTDPMGKEFGHDAVTRIMKAVNCALEQEGKNNAVYENGTLTTKISQESMASHQTPRVNNSHMMTGSRELHGTSTTLFLPHHQPRKEGWDSESDDSYKYEGESVVSSNDSDSAKMFGDTIPCDGSNSLQEGRSRYDSFKRQTKPPRSSSPWHSCVACIRPNNQDNENDSSNSNTMIPSKLSEGMKRQAAWMKGVADKTIATLESTHEDTMNHILSLENAFASAAKTDAAAARRRNRYREFRKKKKHQSK